LCLQLKAVPTGYLDVTSLGADPTGVTDSTVAIQAGINQARDAQQVLWFPAGDYLVSDRLVADQPDSDGDNYHSVLIGSTLDPASRARIIRAPNSTGFGDSNNRRVLLHFISQGTADAESGNATLYNQGVVSIDFKISAGNPGAVAIRMQGAEGCTIQDVSIDMTEGGHTGIWGIPGSGGATHGIRIVGGVTGVDTRGFANGGGGTQPTAVLTDAHLINQSGQALYATARGAFVVVGSRFERDTPGPLVYLREHWQGQPYDASLLLVDSLLEYTSYHPDNTVIEMHSGNTGRSFLLENSYVSNADKVWHPSALANPNGWVHFKRLAVEVQPEARGWGQPHEPVYLDGAHSGGFHMDAQSGVVPPSTLTTVHEIPANFPTWETPGAVDVTSLGVIGDGVSDDWAALQQAIDTNEVLFFPKGEYRVSKTLELQPDSKLIGVWPSLSVLQPISTLQNPFNAVQLGEADAPLIRSADTAQAETYLGFLRLMRTFPLAQHDPTSVANYALEWRSGGDSVVRHVMLQGKPGTNMRPDLIAQHYYDLTENINANHPQDDFPEGMYAWPCAYPNIQVRGHGGGRWFTFWMHGRQGLRDDVPFLLVENTNEPLQLYHLHLQQQDSLNHAEFINANNVTVYGTKGEIKGSMLYFENCDNVRLFGHGGLSSPDPVRNPPYLFRFVDCTNFLVSGLGDTINQGIGKWNGGAFDRWYHANVLSFFPLQDSHSTRGEVIIPSDQRPILYLQGSPVRGIHPQQGNNTPPVVQFLSPASGGSIPLGVELRLIGSAHDVEDGDLSENIEWYSSLDGLLGSGAQLDVVGLSEGSHVISASVVDGAGFNNNATLALDVVQSGTQVQIQLQPSDDSYVAADYPDSNQGSNNKLRARNSQGHQQLFKFDLSAVSGAISQASLYVATANSNAGVLSVHQVIDDNWSESSVTWNYQRPAVGALIESATASGFPGQWLSFDVASYLSSQLVDGVAGFAGLTADSTLLLVYSKEQNGSEPYLDIIYGLNIDNQAPVATMTSPANNLQFNEGEPIHLSGHASDVEDGDLSPGAIWTSSIDGFLGSGSSLNLLDLSPGVHQIDFVAVDSGSLVARDSISLEVLASHHAQVVRLQAVADSQIRGDQPDQNFGSEVKLRHRLSEQSSSIYRFDLTGISGVVDFATLRLALGANDSGELEIRALNSDDWDEATVTYSTRPVEGEALTSLTLQGVSGDYSEANVTAHVSAQAGNGGVGFAVRSLGSTLTRIFSREGSAPPELLIAFSGPIGSNAAPFATNVSILGDATVGETLNAFYLYSDVEGDPVGDSIIRWYGSSDSVFDLADVELGQGSSYTLRAEDAGS
ncbi:MAG: DNRLRE domain-containing protein, partial [Halieaceae bacterium]|nr:DNRLRE domain-containing protein [Halieaceae bacterium]